ncbi:MAG: helix-turn-helix domain-containing protein [Actinobacteria bacterium]|nr:helix-turn-helix domain-containing protein [Actinomycetota bacterium]
MPKSEPSDRNNSKTLKDERRKNWFWDTNEIFSSDLSAYAKLVRLYLARCANGDRQAFPSYNRIAKDCGISRDTAKRAVAELEEKGWIEKNHQVKDDGEHLSNIYSLCDPPESPKEELKSVENEVKGGRCSQHPPCHNLEGVGAVGTHIGAESTQVGADSTGVGAETASNNTNITITMEKDINKHSFSHSSMHHNKDNKRAREKTRDRPVDVVNCVDKSTTADLRKILTDSGFEGTQVEVEYIARWVDDFSLEMIGYAIKKSVLNCKKSLPYIRGVFESWYKKGVYTIEQAEEETRYDSVMLTP